MMTDLETPFIEADNLPDSLVDVVDGAVGALLTPVHQLVGWEVFGQAVKISATARK
jgi:hypothetical protein